MDKQVDKTHYTFKKYMHKPRWMSIWHQLSEVLSYNPKNVLEVGPGPGIFKAVALNFGISVETLDIDPELNPDHLCSVFNMHFEDGFFDLVCAFQMLEHLPFERSLAAFREMSRVSSRVLIISVPDASTRYPISVCLPRYGEIIFSIPKPFDNRKLHKFDGEHFWEINKIGYSLETVSSALQENTSFKLLSTYRIPENPYHRFFVFINRQ